MLSFFVGLADLYRVVRVAVRYVHVCASAMLSPIEQDGLPIRLTAEALRPAVMATP